MGRQEIPIPCAMIQRIANLLLFAMENPKIISKMFINFEGNFQSFDRFGRFFAEKVVIFMVLG